MAHVDRHSSGRLERPDDLDQLLLLFELGPMRRHLFPGEGGGNRRGGAGEEFPVHPLRHLGDAPLLELPDALPREDDAAEVGRILVAARPLDQRREALALLTAYRPGNLNSPETVTYRSWRQSGMRLTKRRSYARSGRSGRRRRRRPSGGPDYAARTSRRGSGR